MKRGYKIGLLAGILTGFISAGSYAFYKLEESKPEIRKVKISLLKDSEDVSLESAIGEASYYFRKNFGIEFELYETKDYSLPNNFSPTNMQNSVSSRNADICVIATNKNLASWCDFNGLAYTEYGIILIDNVDKRSQDINAGLFAHEFSHLLGIKDELAENPDKTIMNSGNICWNEIQSKIIQENKYVSWPRCKEQKRPDVRIKNE